jgi:hypothetical protein
MASAVYEVLVYRRPGLWDAPADTDPFFAAMPTARAWARAYLVAHPDVEQFLVRRVAGGQYRTVWAEDRAGRRLGLGRPRRPQERQVVEVPVAPAWQLASGWIRMGEIDRLGRRHLASTVARRARYQGYRVEGDTIIARYRVPSA